MSCYVLNLLLYNVYHLNKLIFTLSFFAIQVYKSIACIYFPFIYFVHFFKAIVCKVHKSLHPSIDTVYV